MEVTFENLPMAVKELTGKVDLILEKLSTLSSASDQDEILGVEEAAELLKIAVPTVYDKVHKRQLPVSKKGNRLYFSKWALIEYMQSGKINTESEMRIDAQKYMAKLKSNSVR